MPAILSVLLIAAAAVLCWRMAKQLEAKRRKRAAGDEGCLEYRTSLAFDECLDALAAHTDQDEFEYDCARVQPQGEQGVHRLAGGLVQREVQKKAAVRLAGAVVFKLVLRRARGQRVQAFVKGKIGAVFQALLAPGGLFLAL